MLLRRLRAVGRIGIVFEHLRHDRSSDQRLELGLQRFRLVLFVDLPAADIERKRLDVFFLLGGVFDGRFRPFIERVFVDALGLGLVDIVRKGIELAFQPNRTPITAAMDRAKPISERGCT
jgi:hypothetical protein